MACIELMVVAAFEKTTASGMKMQQWSVTLLPTGKRKVVDNMLSSLF